MPDLARLGGIACLVTFVAVGFGVLTPRSSSATLLDAGSPPVALSTPASYLPPKADGARPLGRVGPEVLPLARVAAPVTIRPRPAVHPKHHAARNNAKRTPVKHRHPPHSPAKHSHPRHRHHHAHVTPTPAPPPTLDFTISSFNVLGSNHTVRGGTHARWASGPVRAHWATALLLGHGVDVVGLQELQPPQLNVIRRSYAVWPGYSLGRAGTDNSIGWRTDTWELVNAYSISIPYFHGRHRPMPYVLLRNSATGVEAWFANFHNPADVRGNQQHWRTIAETLEISLVNRLRHNTGLPVFVTGDMNERAEVFCRMTGGAGMIAAAGGTNSGGCRPARPTNVDWIFGTPDVAFSGYTVDRSRLVSRTSDHPMMISQVHLVGTPAG
jgi:endonuclease/exonuclease/phosphatase family metal-dependent hydrolase